MADVGMLKARCHARGNMVKKNTPPRNGLETALWAAAAVVSAQMIATQELSRVLESAFFDRQSLGGRLVRTWPTTSLCHAFVLKARKKIPLAKL